MCFQDQPAEIAPVVSRILPLSPEAISHIQASKEITTLSEVVIALLQNSLDAAATKIDIHVNFVRASCTVEDNGIGILPTEFAEPGGLGQPYHTSKADDSDDRDYHGGTGTSLASIAASALLKITSCHGSDGDANTIVLHNGKFVSRQSRSQIPRGQFMVELQGTQIEVYDLFGNIPVRLKQRASETGGRHRIEKLWSRLKHDIAGFLLAWPRPCAVKLSIPSGTDGGLRSVHYHSRSPSTLTHRNLNQFDGLPTKTDPRDALCMLYEAQLASGDTRRHWVPLTATAGALSVHGAICKRPVPTRQCQFLSIGIYPCLPSGIHDELYEAVNKAFTNSSFAVVEDDIKVLELQRISTANLKHNTWDKSSVNPMKKFTSKRGIEKWPMFVLQLRLHDQKQHRQLATKTSDVDLAALVEILRVAVTQWLTVNQFQPRKRKHHKIADRLEAVSHLNASRAVVSEPLLLTPRKRQPMTPIQRPLFTTDTLAIRVTNPENTSAISTLMSRRPDGQPARAFSAWSRIKSSRSMHNETGTVKRPSTMPGRIEMSGRPKQLSFDVPVLEARKTDNDEVANTTGSKVLMSNLLSKHDDFDANTASSDDYGSFDEAAMCEMATSPIPGRGHSLAMTTKFANDVPHSLSSRDIEHNEDEDLDWADSITGEMFKINVRTGMLFPKRLSSICTSARHTTDTNTSLALTARLKISSCSLTKAVPHQTEVRKEPWLQEFLQQWENPVFQRQSEAPIPVIPTPEPYLDRVNRFDDQLHNVNYCGIQIGEDIPHTSTQLAKASLKKIKVISQVDRKFILCRLTHDAATTKPTSLIIVDQHAASERVILESLFAELCTPVDPSSPTASLVTNLGFKSAVNTILLDNYLQFEISEIEYDLSIQYGQNLATWGILYDAVRLPRESVTSHKKVSKCRILVRALPPGISSRCVLTPGLLIELLRAELWRQAESWPSVSSTVEEAKMNSQRWFKHLGSCPKGIIEMLNSRACRSAIMFNDTLELHECEKLLADLAHCTFPFVCAHGRASMVPLVELSGQSNNSIEENIHFIGQFTASGAATKGYLEAFRDWQNVT
nr:dna mismatch repair protein mlh3 [Quercus suber]